VGETVPMSVLRAVLSTAVLACLVGSVAPTGLPADSFAGSHRTVKPGVPKLCSQISHQNPEYKRCKQAAKKNQ
jgi:hypothetical protein